MKPNLILVAVTVATLATANMALAVDSAKVNWNGNGHSYQLFDRGYINWADAKAACEKEAAHLATITREEEQEFIATKLLVNRDDLYHIGGTDAKLEMGYR